MKTLILKDFHEKHFDGNSSEGPEHRPGPLILNSNHPRSTLHYSKRPEANQCACGTPTSGDSQLIQNVSKMCPKLTFFCIIPR